MGQPIGKRRILPTRADGKADDRLGFRKRKAKPVESVDTSDLAEMTPEKLAIHLSREALLAAAGIMRKPGRNAAAQMRAIELVTRYGVQEPAKATTVSAPDGGAIQSRHEIVFVRPGEIPEGLK